MTKPKSERGLSVRGIWKSFEEKIVLKDISFDVADGEVIALLGPSGCGKSTVLYVVGGLESPDRGGVLWDGRDVTHTPPHQRGFGLMFQDYMLFPHMNVSENIAFGLAMSGRQPQAIQMRVAEMLELIGLPGYESRDVATLSGGEQQRVALARALAPHPALLMLDEPLGSIDRRMREHLLMELGQILRRMKQTAIYVTHDQEEAFAIADRVILMRAGQVEQSGSPQAVYRNPASLFVAQFMGLSNLIPGTVQDRDGRAALSTDMGTFSFQTNLRGPVVVLVRPDEMHLDHGPSLPTKYEHEMRGRLLSTSFRGHLLRAVIQVHHHKFDFDFLSNEDLPPPGSSINLRFDPEKALQLFPPLETGAP